MSVHTGRPTTSFLTGTEAERVCVARDQALDDRRSLAGIEAMTDSEQLRLLADFHVIAWRNAESPVAQLAHDRAATALRRIAYRIGRHEAQPLPNGSPLTATVAGKTP